MKPGCPFYRLGLTLLLCLIAGRLFGASFKNDFAVVFIDKVTEEKLGAFPLDRSYYANAIVEARKLGAKGVVLKFFFDQPGSQTGDALLASATTNLPVLLQARIDDSEAHPNPLSDRFTLPGIKTQTEVAGVSGSMPLTNFSASARDVGFVDFSTTRVPLLETFQSRTVKSLIVCCIELATGKPAVVNPGRAIKFGTNELQMDGTNCVTAAPPAKDDLEYIPFHDFVAGKTPAEQVKGKVVIIGYDGAKIHSEPTPIGPIRAHRFFVYVLRSIYEHVDN